MTVDPATPTDVAAWVTLAEDAPLKDAATLIGIAVPALAAALSSERAVSAGLRAEVERLRAEAARNAAEFIADAYRNTAQILEDRADTNDPRLTALVPGMRASAIVLRDAADGFLTQARAALAAAQPTKETP